MYATEKEGKMRDINRKVKLRDVNKEIKDRRKAIWAELDRIKIEREKKENGYGQTDKGLRGGDS